MNNKLFILCCSFSALIPLYFFNTSANAEVENLSPLTLSQCIDLAMEQNKKRKISKLALATAESQHKQALSSLWPQITLNASYDRRDEDVNFIFPENTYTYRVNLPGMPPIAGQTVVPEQNVTVMDRDTVLSTLKINYPLFTGGLRSGSIEAARFNVQAARESSRRTELQLIHDVQRMYYGAVLAKRLAEIGEETLTRLETTTELTERLYKEGTGSVTKLDYLRSMVVVESARSIVERLTSNVELANAALANTIGLPWNATLALAETTIPFFKIPLDLDKFVAGVYLFNPDWKQLAAGLEAAQALVKKEKSGYWPKIALTGSLWKWENSLDNEGLVTEENEDGWNVGIGVQLPIFTGFMTTNKVKEAKLHLRKLEAEQILLKEGLALQVKHGVIRVDRSRKIHDASAKAAVHAQEHRELAVRAYMNELIPTQEVIESQIYEAVTRAKSEMAHYENVMARFEIDFIIGKEVQKLLGTGS